METGEILRMGRYKARESESCDQCVCVCVINKANREIEKVKMDGERTR